MCPPLFRMNKNAGCGKRRKQAAPRRPNFLPTEKMPKKYFTSLVDTSVPKSETAKFVKKFTHRRTEILRNAIADAIGGNPKFLRCARAMPPDPFTPDLTLEIRETEIPTSCGKLSAFVHAPKNCRKCAVYFHGGGWTLGRAQSKFCNDFAAGANCAVVSVDYPLAPECRFPEQPRACFEAFEYVRENAKKLGLPNGKFALAGDSSGGNIALAVSIKLAEKSQKQADGLVLYYPVASVFEPQNSESWRKYGRRFALDAELMESFTLAYLPKPEQRLSQYASPLLYDRLSELPPTLLVSSGCDILRDQSRRLAKKLSKARHVEIANAAHMYISECHGRAYATALRETFGFVARL